MIKYGLPREEEIHLCKRAEGQHKFSFNSKELCQLCKIKHYAALQDKTLRWKLIMQYGCYILEIYYKVLCVRQQKL